MSPDDRALFDEPAEGTELHRWETEGRKLDYSNITSYIAPEENYHIEVTVDEPVQGILIRLYRLYDMDKTSNNRASEHRIAQTVHERLDPAFDTIQRFAAAAEELDEVDKSPTLGPEYPDEFNIEHPDYTPREPDDWAGTQEEWNEVMEEAKEKAGPQRGRPHLSRKEIDGRDYYYLQWRNDGEVISQYVAPVDPK
jgi:hypothetical protein